MTRTDEIIYSARVDWQTVVPMGDTLAVSTDGDLDDAWVNAFQVVLEEHERREADRSWSGIDFKYAGAEDGEFVLFVRQIEPDAQSIELRTTVEELVSAANGVARVGTHVYELARELREPESAAPRGSVPPPPFDPLNDELDADAA